MSCSVFITGTDTGIGKTTCSAALLVALRGSGLRAVGMKPVASGCRETALGLRNDDAELLLEHGEPGIDYALVNPYAFAAPIAPSIAAADAGTAIELDILRSAFATLARHNDVVVVEGVGGWAAPLSATLMQADLVRELRLPVILVVGLRLGCINHAVLSARAIVADGCELLGWIANTIDPQMLRIEENLAALKKLLPAPCLGRLPTQNPADPIALASELDDAVRTLA
ncbi:dethiobiotin synthase [Pseudolysobacter antarcticus]|uniref:ATP-dependent dethiobiotin synthetase BioD n=1 Tax=Pseudolysobacter antarcticus TaxID=2511995 RepID=A0A411HNX4_9GAMM|nr:dethiobiotin synthase [Pseudolysobacter antarcticus]QBB72162.1 dethiobiotin synthase [Pseudolysobacter antarcticus]